MNDYTIRDKLATAVKGVALGLSVLGTAVLGIGSCAYVAENAAYRSRVRDAAPASRPQEPTMTLQERLTLINGAESDELDKEIFRLAHPELRDHQK